MKGALRGMFLHTRYDMRQRERIGQLLTDALHKYPTLKLERFKGQNCERDPFLLKLQGAIPIQYNGSVVGLPVCVLLPDSFPLFPPLLFIQPPPGPQRASRQARRVDLRNVVRWESARTTICKFLDDVIAEFSRNCPATPEEFVSFDDSGMSAPPQEEQAFDDTDKEPLVADIREELKKDRDAMEAALASCKSYALVEHACEVAFKSCQDLQMFCQQSQSKLKQSENPPSYTFPPGLLEDAESRASHEAFISVIQNELLKLVHDGKLTMENYVKILRDKARGHFKTIVFTAISK